MKEYLVVMLLLASLSSCKYIQRHEEEYFHRGDFSRFEAIDTALNNSYSKLFMDLDEAQMQKSTGNSFRLVIKHPGYNPVIIHVNNLDSVSEVVFKISPDRIGRERSGLSMFSLEYKSSSGRMDSLYHMLIDKVTKYDFHNPVDDPKDYDIADGTSYLLECFYNGNHYVVLGVGISKKGYFKGSDRFFPIVNSLESFVPKALLPDFDNAETIEDVIFPVLKRDTVRFDGF